MTFTEAFSHIWHEQGASIIRQFYVIDAQTWTAEEKARQKRAVFDKELEAFMAGGWASAKHLEDLSEGRLAHQLAETGRVGRRVVKL